MSKYIKDVHNIRKRYDSGLQSLKKGIIPRNKKLKINPINLKYVLDYLEQREKYLQNVNGYSEVAKVRYSKTLYKEMAYCKNILVWFNDIDIKEITKERLEALYQGIETGKIKGINGKSVSDTTKEDYYRLFKGGFFEFLGVNHIAKETILRKFRDDQEVEFFRLEVFQKLVSKAKLRTHKLLLWLMFDTGIEIGAILQLRKNDFNRSNVGDTYIVHVSGDISKKSRSKRDIFIIHPETNQLLKECLEDIEDNAFLFDFKAKNVEKVVRDIVTEHNIKTEPGGKRITPKHFRSSCACYLLLRRWNTDKIKARLGHKASSRVIDRYVNYLAINQEEDIQESKELDLENYKELYRDIQSQNVRLQEELNTERKEREKLYKEFKKVIGVISNNIDNPKLKEVLKESA